MNDERKVAGMTAMHETQIEETECGGYLVTQTDGVGNESRIYIASYAAQEFLDMYCDVTGERPSR